METPREIERVFRRLELLDKVRCYLRDIGDIESAEKINSTTTNLQLSSYLGMEPPTRSTKKIWKALLD